MSWEETINKLSFKIFDTVEIRHKNFDSIRGFYLFGTTTFGTHDVKYNQVIIANYYKTVPEPRFIVNGVEIYSCRMVLIEKFDKKLEQVADDVKHNNIL